MASSVLGGFPTQFDGPIPLFTVDGFLPPGDFGPSRLEFEERFVNIGDVPRRAFLYTGWNTHRDAYPIYALPEGDPLYAVVTVGAIEYWTKWFGRSRSGNPKGRVWATTGGFR